MFGLVIVGAIIFNRKRLTANAAYTFLKCARDAGKVKFKVLLFALQVRGWGVCVAPRACAWSLERPNSTDRRRADVRLKRHHHSDR